MVTIIPLNKTDIQQTDCRFITLYDIPPKKELILNISLKKLEKFPIGTNTHSLKL